MSGIKLQKVTKRFSEVEVIHGIDLDVDDGEFCVFVGPSGCGKSTLLRMIAGLEDVSGGQIGIGSRDVTAVDPADRGVAMVFQTYALYPHMSVRENMGFGLKMNKVPKEEVKSKVDKAADILKLGPYMERKPKALSGGQRQRVAIGRAIVRGPEVFLFDEPLSNLDAELRLEMRIEIARLHKDLGATMIYVTHDQVEAMTLADKIVVLKDGYVEQVGAPLELYSNPDNKFVAGFIGSPAMNFLKGKVVGNKVEIAAIDATIDLNISAAPEGGEIWVGLRPEHLQIDPVKSGCTISLTEELGGVSYVYLDAPGQGTLVVEVRGVDTLEDSGNVGLNFDEADALFFDAANGARLR